MPTQFGYSSGIGLGEGGRGPDNGTYFTPNVQMYMYMNAQFVQKRPLFWQNTTYMCIEDDEKSFNYKVASIFTRLHIYQ